MGTGQGVQPLSVLHGGWTSLSLSVMLTPDVIFVQTCFSLRSPQDPPWNLLNPQLPSSCLTTETKLRLGKA